MAKLENWYMVRDNEKSYRFAGNVTGHKAVQEGTFIFTTPVTRIVRKDGELIADTRNTQYQIQIADMQTGYDPQLPQQMEKVTNGSVAYYFVLSGLVTEFFNEQAIWEQKFSEEKLKKYEEYLGKLGEGATEEFKYFINLKKLGRQEEAEGLKLEEKEMHIELDSQNLGLFSKGHYRLGGKEITLEEPIIKTGVTQDIIQFTDELKQFDLSAFILHRKLKVYHWWGIITKIYFVNRGVETIEVEWGKERILIKSQQAVSINLT